MTDTAATEAPPTSLPEVSGRMATDLASLDTELAEIDLLISQAQAESARHETRRAAGADKISAAEKVAESSGTPVDPTVAADLNAQLVLLTQRAALMATQVEVLEGKRRVLGRYRDGLAAYVDGLGSLVEAQSTVEAGKPAKGGAKSGDKGGSEPAVSRLLLDTQEDLRREIAKAMHDGPTQSLTNILLQAQIVERLADGSDPGRLNEEVRLLMEMVQQTLESTKSFIFDVRPMVLDDLGLMPTLRRATRERAKHAGIKIDFDSMGTDRRLSMELESGLFRIIDEAMAAFIAAQAERISVRLDWAEQLEVLVSGARSVREVAKPADEPDAAPAGDLPPALAAMMEDRRADARDAVEAAKRAAMVALPPSTWRAIQGRASTLGLDAELLADGAELRLVGALPTSDPAPPAEPIS